MDTFKIFYATEHLNEPQTSYAGCPLIARSGAISPVACRWLMYLWRDRAHDTANAYVFGLKAWLTWLAFHRIDWWRVTSEDISRFGRALQARQSARSANVAISAVCSFYKWAFDARLSPLQPFTAATRRSIAARGPVVTIAKINKREPRVHTKEEFEALLASLPRKDAGLNMRDELIAELGRSCGLRRHEAAALSLSDVKSAKKNKMFFLLRLRITKGCKPRTVPVPELLMHRIFRYVDVYRREIAERYPRRAAEALFLTCHGRPYRRQSITASTRDASVASGIPACFHEYRGAFVTVANAALRRAGVKSRRLVQDMAGHSSETTTAIYDRSSAVEENDRWIAILERGRNV